jgi:hypothetical protein
MGFKRLFMSHLPLDERIEALRRRGPLGLAIAR